jgi:hypothetical protein
MACAQCLKPGPGERNDWLNLSASVAVVRSAGVELGLETAVPRGRGRASLGFSCLIGALRPISWKIVLESPEHLEAFISRSHTPTGRRCGEDPSESIVPCCDHIRRRGET